MGIEGFDMHSNESADAAGADSSVAIVGMGCRFPGGARDPQSFWELLSAGVDAVGDVPADRWQTERFFDTDPATPGRMFVRQGGYLDGPVDGFDADFFGMSPREAAPLDPQQRLLLEVTWEAFEDAGMVIREHAGANIGVYVGGFTFDAATLQLNDANRDLVSAATSTGVSMTMLAARLSYTFDWCGPSLTIDTACSSSLVAFHQACAALTRGECEVAVAGGVNVMVNPVTSILMSKGQFLSPDARCKSFDHRANGYARGEGAGIILLKSLSAARRDGDRIHAIVRGTAVNQDGHTPGITVPSGTAQQSVIRRACEVGRVDPRTIGYFEAHGTGTAVGDPIEATAIGEVLGDSPLTHWIGSVKSNIGHTEAAAGVAALIKAVLCLQHEHIPASLHFERPNPRIPFDRLPLRVPTEMVAFDRAGGPLRVGVNSFGFGGTNAHAVLEEAPQEVDPAPWRELEVDEPVLLPLSARSSAGLDALVEAYAHLLDSSGAPPLREVAAAAGRNRDHHSIRTFVVAVDAREAVQELRVLTADGAAPRVSRDRRGGTCFVYTGMGPQWWGMGRELLQKELVFADTVRECDQFLSRFGISIEDEFSRDEESSRLNSTLYAQVGNFVLQAGLTALHDSWGLRPDVIVGHSVGEVASCYAAGVYSLEDALTVSYHRARLQSQMVGRGAMAAVHLAAADVEEYLDAAVSVAAINSASTTTVSGETSALEGVVEALREAGIAVTPLRVEVAYHSPQMDEIREPLLEALRGLRPSVAHTPLYSTVTGGRVDGPELGPEYWWDNVRQPVLFAAAFHEVLTHDPDTIIEIGPHPVLATAMDEALTESGRDPVVLAVQRRDRPQREQLRRCLGAAYVAGATLDWKASFPGRRPHPRLPSYPWQRERHWLESTASRAARLGTDGSWLTGHPVSTPEPAFEAALSLARFPYLTDHRIGDTIVFPGSGYLDAALGLFPDDPTCVLRDIVFQRPLTIPPRSIPTLRTSYDTDTHRVSLQSRSSGQESWTLHAHLHHPEISLSTPAPYLQTLDELTAGLASRTHDEVYAMLEYSRLNYGPVFRGVREVWHRQETGEVFAKLDAAAAQAEGHRLHPATLDAALQAVIAGSTGYTDDPSRTYVPARIDEFRFYRPPGRHLWMHGRDRRGTETDRLQCDLTLITDGGEIVAELVGLQFQLLDGAGDGTESESTPSSLYYRYTWSSHPLPDADVVDETDTAPDGDGDWIVVGPPGRRTAIAEGIVGRGGRVGHVTPTGPWLDEVAARTADMTCRGVVLLVDDHDDAAGTAVCEDAVRELLPLVQALDETTPRLTVITRATQTVTENDHTHNPFAAAAWGLVRVVNAERPELRCRLIDLDADPGAGAGAEIVAVLDELICDQPDDVAFRAGNRYVRRIERAGQRSAVHHVQVTTHATPVVLRAGGTAIDDLHFVAAADPTPGPGEVQIDVAHVGVNFKDLLKVTGLLPREAMEGTHSGRTLGLECSGTVTRIGPEVRGLKPGDEVFAHSRDLFASSVIVDHERVVRRPAELSAAQAASLLPAATAFHSLVDLARVVPGERVLVHSATGGVGLAAVRLAHQLGALVYATAGTEERRELLRQEGVAGVSDSRSNEFADDIRRQSNGVDVVLNSLPGEMLRESLRLLRPFGRFVELGKADIAANQALRLAAFHRSLSFHAFDYDQLMHLHPDRVRRGMKQVAELFGSGTLTPLPVLEVAAADVDTAFRAMARREHIGKIVVNTRDEPLMVPASSVPRSTIRSDGTYVITGGLGGLGLTVARWLVEECGARHLVLIGRRGVTSETVRRDVDDLTALGARIRIEQVDVVRRDLLATALDRIRDDMPPLRGIIHGAAGFDDVVLAASSPERLVSATGPKADGAWNLHLETVDDELDFFVLFSSVAAQLGAAGAGAYATANEFLNSLARYRAGLGLPATSIGWGVIADVGVVQDKNETVGGVLRRNGHVGITPARFVAELAVLLKTRPVEVSVADIRWSRWASRNPQLAELPRYTDLVPAGGTATDGSSASPGGMGEATREEALSALPGLISPLLQRVTGLSAEQLDDERSVEIDSLSAVELRTLLHTTVGISVAAIQLQQNLTLTGLSMLLADQMERARTQKSAATEVHVHEFDSLDGFRVYGHLSVPPTPGPHPVVVVCTSGSGGALDAGGNYLQISEHAPLLTHGFAVFTVDQRGAPGHGDDYEYAALAEMGGRDIDDVIAAARYVAELADIDQDRVNLLGTSRGGYSAVLAMAREPSLWHRAALLMGLYEPSHLVEVERSTPGTVLHGGATLEPDEMQDYFAAAERQPLAVLHTVRTPILVIHGDADSVIPHQQSVALTERAGELDLPARLTTVPGLGHDVGHTDPAWTVLWPEIAEFFGEDAQ